jgi:hypothetical protein
MTITAPSAAELETNPVVQAAIEAAWVESLVSDPQRRHEEGGWIYFNPTTSEVTIIRAPTGSRAAIDLNNPPEVPAHFVVGKFHTHPNTTAEGWDPGPSQGDIIVDERHGVPDLIRADNGLHHSGPATRRRGLIGSPGFPEEI